MKKLCYLCYVMILLAGGLGVTTALASEMEVDVGIEFVGGNVDKPTPPSSSGTEPPTSPEPIPPKKLAKLPQTNSTANSMLSMLTGAILIAVSALYVVKRKKAVER